MGFLILHFMNNQGELFVAAASILPELVSLSAASCSIVEDSGRIDNEAARFYNRAASILQR
jgi:hypothetical protein